MLRLMQGFSCLLWFCLMFGIYEALKGQSYLALLVGITANLAMQFGTRVAIRLRKLRLAHRIES